MKRGIILVILLFGCILASKDSLSFSFFFSPKVAEAQITVSPIPVRKFTLDLDRSFADLNSSTGKIIEGRLKEFSEGSPNSPIKDWKIKFDKKGESRAICYPLMFNLSFDKTDSSGNKKPLFNGHSTYQNYNILEYQELRFIPNCDVWNDYNWVGDVGFVGALTPHTREAFAHSLYRKFGIAVPEIVAYADITFNSSDPKYNNKTYRYIVVQRANEQDDQIPFTKQFNLKTDLYEEGNNQKYYTEDPANNRLKKINIIESKTGAQISLNLDTINSAKLLFLSDFIAHTDIWFLRNESYGTKLSDNKNYIIPHSLDSTFTCSPQTPNNTHGGYKKSFMPPSDLVTKKIYFDEFQKFFGDMNNLYTMERIVDSLQGTLLEKNQLKNFLRLRFHQYAEYSASSEFANIMYQPYVNKKVSLPFGSSTAYEYALRSFLATCGKKVYRNDVNVIVSPNPKLTFNKVAHDSFSEPNQAILSGDYSLEFKGGAEIKVVNNGPDLRLRKSAKFSIKVIDSNNKTLAHMSNTLSNQKPNGVSDEVGIYYILKSGDTATYQISSLGQVYGKSAPYGTELYMVIESLDPNNSTHPITARKNISNKAIVTYPLMSTPPDSISAGNNLILQD